MKYWSKSALSVYRYLEQMANTIDKLVLDTGKNSNNQNLIKYQTTMYQTGKIIEYMDRKRKIINLKVAVEDSLQCLPKIERRLLTLVFIDSVKSEVVAGLLNISLRTFFRKKIIALNNFKDALISNGFDSEFFELEYSNENWLSAIYQNITSKDLKEDANLNIKFINKMLSQVSNVHLPNISYV